MYTDMSEQAPDEYLVSAVQQAMDGMTRETIEAQMTDSYAGQMGTDPETVRGYIAQMDDETLFDYVRQMLREQIAAQYAETVSAQLAGLSSEQLAAAMDAAELTTEQVQYLYDTYVPHIPIQRMRIRWKRSDILRPVSRRRSICTPLPSRIRRPLATALRSTTVRFRRNRRSPTRITSRF